MWHLINRLVDTFSLCLYCIFACFKVYECWHGDYFVYILHVYSYIFAYVCVYLFCMTVCCMITSFFFMLYVWLLLFFRDVSHVDYIDWFSYLPFIVTHFVVWLSCFPWHTYSYFCISHSSWHDWLSLLYNILFVSTYCLLC